MMAKEDPITIEKIKEEKKEDENEIVTNDN